jgi:EAL domain-containing protein (putative c-di-GMP-specific phosphodiesterase class I)
MKRRRGGPRVDAAESDEGRDEKLQPTLSSLLYDELTDLPTVPLLLGRIRDSLQTVRQLGLLSISVLRDERVEPLLGWQGYEGLMRDIASFLLEIKQVALRRDDFVSEVMISGNAFVILLSPPRREDRVTYADLDKVRCRIESKLARFVRDRLAAEVVDRYGLYVGCAVMHQTSAVRFEKLVYSALDEAFRDSLEQRKRAQRLDAARFLEVLRAGAVHSVYQPVVDLEERRALGFEALTRVSNGAFPGPERPFKVARENNAIWRLERLCPGRSVEPDSVRDPELRGETTFNLLRASRLQPSQVVLEMTEHSAVRDMLELRQVLDYFKFLGYRLAMDDVGSGYSGLKAIAELKPDFIKIDMSLIRDIDRHPIKQDLTGTIARFSIRSGITLIAEGVERPEELRCLKEIGVRYAQGFLFARPGPPFPPLVTRVFD